MVDLFSVVWGCRSTWLDLLNIDVYVNSLVIEYFFYKLMLEHHKKNNIFHTGHYFSQLNNV